MCFPSRCRTRPSAVAHLDKYIEADTVYVIDVAQAKQTSEEAASQHAHCQVPTDGQAFTNDTTVRVRVKMTAQ